MRITAPVTDYIRQSILTTKGDLVVRGVAIPERLVADVAGTVLASIGPGFKPAYASLFDLTIAQGDLWVRGAILTERLAATTAGKVLTAAGVPKGVPSRSPWT